MITTSRPVLFAAMLALLWGIIVPLAAAVEPADSCLLLYGVYRKNPNTWPVRNACLRYTISQSQWTVQKGDVLEYEIFIPQENPEKSGGVDLLGENNNQIYLHRPGEDDKSWLRTCKAVDQNGIAAEPSATLEPAVDKWYARQIPLDGLIGKKIVQTALVFDSHRETKQFVAEPPAECVLFVDNIRIRHADQSVTVLSENSPAPLIGIRRLAIDPHLGRLDVAYDAANGPGPFGPVFDRSHYASYPALLSIPRERVKSGFSVQESVKLGRQQSLRLRQAQKLALECHFIKSWIESDKSPALEKELGEVSCRVYKLFDPGLSTKAFEAGLKDLTPALAGLSKATAARAREKFAGQESWPPQLVVDFSKEMRPATHVASGFLNGFLPDEPPDEVIAPLKPQSLRGRHRNDYGTFASYERAKRLGVKHVSVVVSAMVHDGGGVPWPGEKNDWSVWEAAVEHVVKEAQSKNYRVEWDVWNEPNSHFWRPTPREQGRHGVPAGDRWKETWKRAVLKIRSLDPQAAIIGPSTSGYDEIFLKDFLLYARDQKVLPDWLSWHEMTSGNAVVKNVQAMREFMKANNIPELLICINEYCMIYDQFHPGVHVNYFAAFERAGVVSANRSCWQIDDAGCGNCEDLMLNGLLTQPEKEPRSTWWTFKGYADITGTLVDVQPMQVKIQSFDAVAGYDAARKQAHVLLGRHGGVERMPSPCIVRLIGMDKAAGVVKNNKVRVTGAWIPNTDTRPLLRPLATLDGEYEVKDNAVTVVVPHIRAHDAYTLTLGDPDKGE